MRKFNLFKLLIVCLIAFFFQSCFTIFLNEENLQVRKHQSIKQVKAFGISVKAEQQMLKSSKKYNANLYMIKAELYSGTHYYYNQYYYAFKNDSLIYWGYPYEFLRHSNPLIRDIAIEAVDSLDN